MHTHCTQSKSDVNIKQKQKIHRKDVAEQFYVCQKEKENMRRTCIFGKKFTI